MKEEQTSSDVNQDNAATELPHNALDDSETDIKVNVVTASAPPAESVDDDFKTNKQPTATAEPMLDDDARTSGPVVSSTADITTSKKPSFFNRLFKLPTSKKGKILMIASVIVIVGLGTTSALYVKNNNNSSQSDANTFFSALPVPFVVVSSTPSNDQQGVSPTDKISLKFSHPVSPDNTAGNFFTTPEIEGSYTQGASQNELIFTPKKPLDQPAIVGLMIHGEFQSTDGSVLGADYFLSFSTAIPDNRVVFQDKDYYSDLTSIPANQKETFTILAGKDAISNNALNLYKADAKEFLASYTYKKVAYDGSTSTYDKLINNQINTKSMKLLTTKKDYKDNDTYDVEQPSGVYFLESTSNGEQTGGTWILYSNNGVLVRQDDQMLFAVAKDTKTGVDKTGTITLYNLENKVTDTKSGNLLGITQLATPFGSRVDCAVAIVDGEELIVPINMPNSFADIRVKQDLSKTLTTYAYTDRPVYKTGDVAKLAGFVRLDNDVHYSLPTARTLQLYAFVKNQSVGQITAQINTNGIISANISVTAAMVDADESTNKVDLRTVDNYAVASFAIVNTAKQVKSVVLTAAFDKQSYLANEIPKVTVTAKKSDGSAYANQSVTLSWYEKPYLEGDSLYNESNLDLLGTSLSYDTNGNADTVTLALDSSGSATADLPVSKLSAGSSKAVGATVQVKDTAGIVSTSASSVVHQGGYYINFAPAKRVFLTNEDLMTRVVIYDLQGKIAANVNVDATFVVSSYDAATQKNTEKTIASASGITDGNGLVELNGNSSGLNINDYLSVIVTVADTNNIKVQSKQYLYVKNPDSLNVYSHLQLSNLDVSGIGNVLNVGDKPQMTIHSPYDVSALVTYERGRVLHSEILQLKQGNNAYTLNVTSELAPGFTMVFSYFKDGSYLNDGLVIGVRDAAKNVTVSLTADKQQYAAGDTANIAIATNTVTNSAVGSRLIIKVVDDSIYSINNSIGTDMYSLFYGEREISTNGSSSRTGIGSGGGKCGGEFANVSTAPNNLGSTIFYKTDTMTDKDGKLTISVPLKTTGKWRVIVQSASDQSAVGSAFATLLVK